MLHLLPDSLEIDFRFALFKVLGSFPPSYISECLTDCVPKLKCKLIKCRLVEYAKSQTREEVWKHLLS